MSWQATAWACDARKSGKMNAAHRVILIILANCADDEGRYAFPSVKSMALSAGVDERNVRRSLRWLEEAGVIVKGDQGAASRYRSDRRPTVYDLPISGGASTPSREPDGGASVSTTGGRSYPERGGADAPQTIKEPPKEPHNPPTPPADAASVGDGYGTLTLIEPTPKPRPVEDQLAAEWWEALEFKPSGRGAWHAARKTIRAVLDTGHDTDRVRAALTTITPPLSIGTLEFALRTTRPTTTGPGATGIDDKWDRYTAQNGTRP